MGVVKRYLDGVGEAVAAEHIAKTLITHGRGIAEALEAAGCRRVGSEAECVGACDAFVMLDVYDLTGVERIGLAAAILAACGECESAAGVEAVTGHGVVD